MPTLFPFAEYWWFYTLFTVGVLGLLALDLGVFHREAHVVGFREALGWTIVWTTLSLAFCFGLWRYAEWKLPLDPRLIEAGVTAASASELAHRTALEFLTGYVVELTLSVDNVFVFIVVFTYFGVPKQYQHRVLFYGILGALIFRVIFIALGSVLMKFEWVIWVFGGFLILTGLKILFVPEKPMDPEKNLALRLLRGLVSITPRFAGPKFFVLEKGVRHGTPLLVALAVIEFSDIIFAVDSVPAIFAITNEPLVVFTSNIFAILGLRSMFFLLSGVVDKFRFLKYGLGFVLIFVGLKMAWLNALLGGKFPILWSLGIIGGILASSIAASLLFSRPNLGPAAVRS